jgi:hypothetical protein
MAIPLLTVFADVPDPRRETKNKRHELVDILTLATCAVIAGADGWDQVAAFGRAKRALFAPHLRLPNGVPSPDTFERVFAKLDPNAFADRFGRWMAAACEGTGLVHVAVDGKSARRATADTFTGCLHLVEAWAVENRLILGQRSVPSGGHEITTAPDLLAALDLKGAVVTIDAAFCQKELVSQIRAQGGHYVVCVKGNQKGLHDAVADVFARAGEDAFAGCDMAAEVEDGHGRSEERYVTTGHGPRGAAGRVGRCRCRGAGVPGAGGEREAERGHRPLLPDQLAGRGGGTGRVRPQPLGHRERAPLGSGHRGPGGRQPGSGRTCRGQPGHDPARGPVAPQAGRHQGQHPHPTHEGRLGRYLPAQSTRNSNDEMKCASPAGTGVVRPELLS